MEHGVDSLNVATAAALALWAVRTADRAGDLSAGRGGAPDRAEGRGSRP
jgi:hypothetical protein